MVIGLGSMIGAGIFAVFAPAAAAAGSGLLLALALAAGVAYCNALASAQLAAAYPTSGGTYVYGRERLGPWWGFTAGWAFVIGKTASCAAMALTFASYAVPGPGWLRRVVAVVAVGAIAALNYRGITKTVALTRVLVSLALATLLIVVVGIWTGGPTELDALGPDQWLSDGGPSGILQAAGLLFFAFAGYARIATLGEEVRDPARTIPRAIPLALGLTVAIYLTVAVSALGAAGPQSLASSSAPLATALQSVGAGGLAPVVRVGGAVASLGALLALVAGIGRTSLAMARHRDLPGWLAAVHPRFRVPHHAEIAVAVVVGVAVMLGDVRTVIGFSSFGVLVYYGIANASAFTQPRSQRRWPRALNVVGAALCALLAVTLPWPSVVVGAVVLALGLIGRGVVLRQRAGAAGSPQGG